MWDLPYAEKAHIVPAARLKREREREGESLQFVSDFTGFTVIYLTECNVCCLCAKVYRLDRRTT